MACLALLTVVPAPRTMQGDPPLPWPAHRPCCSKVYRWAGTTYIIGRVCRQVKKGKNASLFHLKWIDSQFQNAVEHVSVGVVQRGINNYVSLMRSKNQEWTELVEPDSFDEIDVDSDSELEEAETFEMFDPGELLPTSLAEIETIKSMRFVPSTEMEAPSYLYEHLNSSTRMAKCRRSSCGVRLIFIRRATYAQVMRRLSRSNKRAI
ncbi:hypothetical protein PC128_g26991 [Phytophthora cactorum]|nr:hypothetical protein PC128_g26991 [Phytophthora cactorum]